MSETRQYRGLVRTSLTAGAVLAALATGSLALGLAAGVVPESVFGARELVALAVRGFIVGAVTGALFSAFIRRGAREQTLSTLTASRVALWGGLASASVPILTALMSTGPVLPIGILAASTALFGFGGAAVSAGMLRMAQRAPERISGPDAKADRLLP